MKYLLAIGVCGVIVVVYATIGALLGWKHGGGILPMMVLVGVLGVVWKGITGTETTDKNEMKK